MPLNKSLEIIARNAGVSERDIVEAIFSDGIQIDKEAVVKQYQNLEEGINGIPKSISGLGVGSLREELNYSSGSFSIAVTGNPTEEDFLIGVSKPFYIIRVMTGKYLDTASGASFDSQFSSQIGSRYRIIPSGFAKPNETIVTNSGLTVFDGSKVRSRIIRRDKVLSYISADPYISSDLFHRPYFELSSWFRAEGLSDSSAKILGQIAVLPSLIRTFVAGRIEERLK